MQAQSWPHMHEQSAVCSGVQINSWTGLGPTVLQTAYPRPFFSACGQVSSCASLLILLQQRHLPYSSTVKSAGSSLSLLAMGNVPTCIWAVVRRGVPVIATYSIHPIYPGSCSASLWRIGVSNLAMDAIEPALSACRCHRYKQ